MKNSLPKVQLNLYPYLIPEEQVRESITSYLKLQYPKVIYRIDLAGERFSKGQAIKLARLQCIKGFPDLFILKAMHGFNGLFIEIKKEGTTIYDKKGRPATEHLKTQFETMERLKECGFFATFGIGFNNCKRIIDRYLKEKTNHFENN
jgi:hypothetical protein